MSRRVGCRWWLQVCYLDERLALVLPLLFCRSPRALSLASLTGACFIAVSESLSMQQRVSVSMLSYKHNTEWQARLQPASLVIDTTSETYMRQVAYNRCNTVSALVV